MNIRKGTKADLPGVFLLINELALFEKAPEAVTNTIAMMENDGFGENPVFGFHVAEVDSEIVGMALYFVKYSTWKGRGLYLDDLIVTEIDAKQVHWQVLDWNTPAVDFYKKLGASIEAEWWDCKMNENEIASYKINN